MQEVQNTKVVQDAYAAFGRGDIQTLLTHIVVVETDDVPRRLDALEGLFFSLVLASKSDGGRVPREPSTSRPVQ